MPGSISSLTSIDESIELLPDPRRHALQAALGMADEFEPDPFLVALAAYQVIRLSAGSGPVVLLVDDAQWLDRSTLGVLTFIARRIDTEPVALVAAVRVGYPTPLDEAHLPMLELQRLSASAAAKLLDRDAPDLHPVLRARVLAEAAGNPLALVELARSLPIAPDWQERISPTPPTLTLALGACVRDETARSSRRNAAVLVGGGARPSRFARRSSSRPPRCSTDRTSGCRA